MSALKPSLLSNQFDTQCNKIRHLNKESSLDINRDELIIMARFDGETKRPLAEVISLRGFKTIHRYDPFSSESKVEYFKDKFYSPMNQILIGHPLVDISGDLYFHSDSPLYKIDACGEPLWYEDYFKYHHSLSFDNYGNIWSPVRYPSDEKIIILDNILGKNAYPKLCVRCIAKVSKNGEILFHDNLLSIMTSYNLIGYNDLLRDDPFHLNDIEVAKKDSNYWKKDDIFLSLRHQSMIIQYRPETKEVIRAIKGPFYKQHDVDIISDTEIAIFNNNQMNDNFGYSELIKYDFEKDEFSKIFNESMIKNGFIL